MLTVTRSDLLKGLSISTRHFLKLKSSVGVTGSYYFYKNDLLLLLNIPLSTYKTEALVHRVKSFLASE